jgi:hypothetical protein
VFRASGVDLDIDHEISFHIESRIADLVAAGMTRDAAAAPISVFVRAFPARCRAAGSRAAFSLLAIPRPFR